MPQTMVLFVIRKLLSISQGFKLYEIRITKRMVEEGGVYELRITNNTRRSKGREVILPYLDRQIAAAETKEAALHK